MYLIAMTMDFCNPTSVLFGDSLNFTSMIELAEQFASPTALPTAPTFTPKMQTIMAKTTMGPLSISAGVAVFFFRQLAIPF